MEEDEGAPIAETNGEAEAPVADGALVGSRTDAPTGDDTPDSTMVLQFESSPSTKRDSAASSDGEGAVPIKRRSENGDNSNERPIEKDAHLREDEDLLGYETTGDESALDNLCSAIERLKKEINSIENSNERFQELSPPPNIATGNAMDDTVSSRPSSGMSMRSDNELGNLNIDMNSASGNRPSFNRKSGVELTNQIYRIPLELGWRRELVYRANFDQNARRQADIYYYSPSGKKLRSTREVAEHLIGTNLSVENFTFFKEALGVDDPEKEIIREAKVLKNKNDSPQPSDGEGQSNTLEGKRTPKPKAPKGSSPERLINTGKSKPLKVKSVGSRLSTGSSPSPTGFNSAKMSPSKDSGASSPKPALRKSADSPQWKKPIIEESPGAKRKARGPPTPKMVPKIAKKAENGTAGQKVGPRGGKVMEAKNKNYFAEFYRTNKEKGYNSLVQIFQYLKMRELAAAARVCRMWRDIAYTPALWKSVRMKNSQVNDWEGLAAALKRHGTRHLDLRKMLHHHPPEVPDKAWDQFIEHISTVDTLIRLDLCRCPASVVERVCERMPQLQALTATSVRCTSLNPAPLTTLTNLQELRIKGMTGLTLTSDLKCLENLTKLKHLCITSVKELGKYGCIAVGGLTMLESLELGECTGEVGGSVLLRRLTNLTRLRLERCPGNTNGGGAPLLKAAAALPLLRQLELINFDIKPGFEDALGLCTNVKRLLIIPTYVSQSATTNRCVLAGVLRLRSTLTHLVWGVTMELLRVTELFIDQCDRTQSQSASGGTTGNSLGDAKQTQHNAQATTPKVRKQGVGDCIPVLKPVPGLPAEEVRMADMAGRPQVEILPLPALQHLLAAELPETRLKLLRIPYHHTWRQTFNDFD